MKNRIINGNPLEFFDSSNNKKGEIKISGSDIIINPLDSSGTVIFGEEGTINDIEIGGSGTPVDFTFLGGGTIAAGGNTLILGESGDTIDLSNATIGTITASIFKGGVFEGDGSGLTNLPSAFTHVTASGNISASGTTHVFGGNVGIGTTTPDASLNIKGSGNDSSTTSLKVIDSDNATLFYVRNDGVALVGHNYLYVNNSNGIYSDGKIRARAGITDDQGPLLLGNNDAVDAMTISSSKVGIGTTTPTRPLHVVGGAIIADTTLIDNPVGSNATLEVYDKAGDAKLVIHHDDGDASKTAELRFRNGGNDTYLKVPSNTNGLVIDTENKTDAFVLDTTGRITSQITASGNISASGTIIAEDFNVNNDILPISNVVSQLGSTSKYFLYVNSYVLRSGGTLQFMAGGTSEKMRILSDGNVGIGTVAPTEALQVTGNISASGNIIGELTGIGGAVTGISSILNTGLQIGRDSSDKIGFDNDNQIDFRVGGGDRMVLSSTGLLVGGDSTTHITASGNIKADGDISASGIGYFKNISIDEASPNSKLHVGLANEYSGKALTLENSPSGRFQAFGFDGANSFYTAYAPTFVIGYGESTGAKPTVETIKINQAGTVEFLSHITASGNISSSGKIYGTHFGTGNANRNALDLGTNNTMQFRVNDGSRLTLTQTVFRPSTDEAVALGRTAQKWSELVVNHVTASGNIISSGTGTNTFGGDINLGANHIGRDGDNYIGFETDNLIKFRVAGATQVKLSDGVLSPQTDSDVDLGTNSVRFKDAYVDSVTVTGNVVANTISATSLNVTSITSSIVTSSILQTEGSNIFGDAASDTHTFNGHITASGNISASGQIFGNSLKSDQYLYLGGDVSFYRDGLNIVRTDDVFHATGDIHVFDRVVNRGQTSNYIEFATNKQTFNVNQPTFTGNITASGNISASEDLTGDEVNINQYINHIGDADTYFGFSANNQVLFHVGGGDRLLINSSGNVGLGTTSPSEKLTVAGDISASGDININNNSQFKGKHTNGTEYGLLTLTNGNQIKVGAYDYTSAGVIFGGGDNTVFNIGTTEVMKLTSTGLEVTGQITASNNIQGASITIGTDTVYSNALNINNSGAIRIGNAEYIAKSGNDLSLFQDRVKVHNVGRGTTFDGSITASADISSSGMGTFAQVRIGESTTTNYGLIVDYPDTRLLRLKRGGSTKFQVIADNADGQVDIYDNSGNSDIRFLADGDSYFTNNLGIGTTGPEAKLTIKSDPGDTNQPTRITNSSTDAHTGLFLNGTGNATSEKYGMQFGGYNEYSIGGIFGVLDSTGGSTSGDITIDFANGTSAGALIEKVRFTHEGNVGIGTSSPSAQLQVHGASDNYEILRIKGSTTEHGSLKIYSGSYNTATIGYHQQGYFFNSAQSSNPNGAFFIRGDKGLDFGVNNTGSLSIQSQSANVIIDSKVKVGIGTASPDASLHVASITNDYVAKFSHTTATGYAPGSILLQAGQNTSRGQGLFHYNTEADDSWFTGVPYNVASTKWIVAHKPDTTFNPDVAQTSHAIFTIDSSDDSATFAGTVTANGTVLTGATDISGKASIVQLNASSSTLQSNIDAKQDTISSGNRLNANLIGSDGSIGNTEFGRLNGVDFNIKTEVDGKASIVQLNASSSALQSNIDGKQASLTFGKSSGNALKSEEALTTNDILLMGSSHVKGRTYEQLKSDLSLGNVEDTAISTFAGSSNITTVGTIGTGTWQGTTIASAYLDSDTAHLSGTQTFSGAKTFSSNITANGNIVGDNGTNITGINSIEVGDAIANSTDNTTKIAISNNTLEFLIADDTVFELDANTATISKKLVSTQITASGNISSSANVFGVTGSFHALVGDTSQETSLEVDGPITGSIIKSTNDSGFVGTPLIVHQFMAYLPSFTDGNFYYGHNTYGPYHHVWTNNLSSEPTDMSGLGAARHAHFMHIVPVNMKNISLKGTVQASNTAADTVSVKIYKTTRSNSATSTNSTLTLLGTATSDNIDNANHCFNMDMSSTSTINAGEALVLLLIPTGTSCAIRANWTLYGYTNGI